MMQRKPFAAHLYFIPRALRRPQAALVRLPRRYFQVAPGWVLLTTTGRKTGLSREVLLTLKVAVRITYFSSR